MFVVAVPKATRKDRYSHLRAWRLELRHELHSLGRAQRCTRWRVVEKYGFLYVRVVSDGLVSCSPIKGRISPDSVSRDSRYHSYRDRPPHFECTRFMRYSSHGVVTRREMSL